LSTDFRKILKYQISGKSVHWDPKFFHADGQTYVQTDMTYRIVVFRNILNASKKYIVDFTARIYCYNFLGMLAKLRKTIFENFLKSVAGQ